MECFEIKWNWCRLLRGVKSLYVGSKACVRVGNEVSEWFPVRVGLRQGCVTSPRLFNLYIDGVVREVNARVLGRGLKLIDGNDNEWELNQLLFGMILWWWQTLRESCAS